MNESFLKQIPASTDAEAAVLGSILIDPDALIQVDDLINANDFFIQRNAMIYRAIQRLAAENYRSFDYITVTRELGEDLAEIGGGAYITELINATPSALYARHYAEIVKDTSVQRQVIGAAGAIAQMAYDESITTTELVNRAQAKILEIGLKQARQARSIAELTEETIDRISDLAESEKELLGLPTGFAVLDNILGGLQRTDLLILAARPGMGKTSLALSLAQTAAIKHSANVAIFSLEMSGQQLVQRLLSMQSGINAHELKLGKITDDEWPFLLSAANTVSKSSIFIEDTTASSVADIRTKARRIHAEHGLDLLIVDYLQLMSGEGGNTTKAQNREQEISYISRSLKGLARELNVPVIALSQLSRAVEGRADKRPFLSDLRESGSLEQDADVVLFIYREDYYMSETDRRNVADIIIAKHRHGETGTVSLFFNKALTLFTPLDITKIDLAY